MAIDAIYANRTNAYQHSKYGPVLVTGGAGYIGSHATLKLIETGYEVVVIDNLSNSHIQAIQRVSQLAQKNIHFHRLDIRDSKGLETIFERYRPQSVMHFAGLKAVSESVISPLDYYQNNLAGTIQLLETMKKFDVYQLVFSSSATVYSQSNSMPVSERSTLAVANPYGRTKLMIEEMLRDLQTANPLWQIAILRYFNPIGAHHSGMIGEDPNGVPSNLLPFISQVAMGIRPFLMIYGDDYDTPDGTGIRDYIHVEDLVDGHIAALSRLNSIPGSFTVNLGTGCGYSVKEVVKQFEKVSGRRVPYKIMPRRAGDVAVSYADTTLAFELLHWKAQRDLNAMCHDTWQWQIKNPGGYNDITAQKVHAY